jgi:FkbM family methyltransferase
MSDAFISYAQNQEDVLLWRVFKDLQDGFYVDVGAAHPEWESVTKAFYDRGWSGINFEPNPHFYSMLEKERPRDINICALAGGENGERELHIVGNSGLSTASREGVDVLREHKHVVTSRIVCKMVRLDDIIREQGVKDIHFLKIDAEGMEKEVLKGCSFSEFRPKILVIEATIPETNILRNDGIREYLASRGYAFMLFDGLNDYFVALECQKLAKEFNRPVNILDNYRRAQEIYLEKCPVNLKDNSAQPRGNAATKEEKSCNGVIGAVGGVLNRLKTWGGKDHVQKLRAEDVDWAYQHFLKRNPESQDIIEYHIKHSQKLQTLVENITKSREYEYKKYNHFSSPDDKPELYYFFHIHKTGGMSVHEYLRDATPKGDLLPGFFEQDILNIGNPQAFRYFSGHFGRLPLLFKGRRLSVATVLRDPVQRGLSHYRHARRDVEIKEHMDKNGEFYRKLHREILNNSLQEFLYSPSASLVFGNHQACQLAELTQNSVLLIKRFFDTRITAEELYELAMEGLSKMELVGTTQKLDEFIIRLADRWDLPQPIKKYVENADPSRAPEHLAPDEIARIRELCSVDLKIYEHVNNLLDGKKVVALKIKSS